MISTASSAVGLASRSCSTDHPFFSMKYVTRRRYLGRHGYVCIMGMSTGRSQVRLSTARTTAGSRSPHPRAPTPGEVEALIDAAKTNRYGHRDATMILLAFRNGILCLPLILVE
jgi:hypothetical protein